MIYDAAGYPLLGCVCWLRAMYMLVILCSWVKERDVCVIVLATSCLDPAAVVSLCF